MIEIKKCTDISEIGFEPPLEAFILFDDGEMKLACIFEVHKRETEVFDIKAFGETQFLYYDAVLRTVAAYSLNKGIELMDCRNKNLYDELKKFAFEEREGKLRAKNALLLVHQCGDRK